MQPSWYYLLINLGSIAVPFLLSFDNRVAFYKKWKAFWPANLITLAFFVVWDIFFTKEGIWGFNDTYLLGFDLFGLPIEEWLFFICIPYACVFLYETLLTYIPGDPFKKVGKPAIVIVALLCIALMSIYTMRLYTSFTALFTLLGLLLLLRTGAKWFGRFILAYLVILIPFIIANGLLTGIEFWHYDLLNSNVSGIADQIVWYNNDHNLRFRVFSVPLDDFLYGFLLIGMNIAIYEKLLTRYQLR